MIGLNLNPSLYSDAHRASTAGSSSSVTGNRTQSTASSGAPEPGFLTRAARNVCAWVKENKALSACIGLVIVGACVVSAPAVFALTALAAFCCVAAGGLVAGIGLMGVFAICDQTRNAQHAGQAAADDGSAQPGTTAANSNVSASEGPNLPPAQVVGAAIDVAGQLCVIL